MGLSLSLFGVANLKKQFLTKVERQHPKNINTLPKWFLKELWDSPETKQLQKFAHMKDFCSPCRGEVSHKQAAHNAVGNSVAWRASQGSNESWAVCGHSTVSSGHLLPVKNQSFGEWQFRVFESKLQYFSRSAES